MRPALCWSAPSCHSRLQKYGNVVFVLVAHIAAHLETRVVDFLLVNMVVVPFQVLSAAVMEYTAVLMDTLVNQAMAHVYDKGRFKLGK